MQGVRKTMEHSVLNGKSLPNPASKKTGNSVEATGLRMREDGEHPEKMSSKLTALIN